MTLSCLNRSVQFLWAFCTHLNPATQLSRDVLPAPDGPIIAVSWPDRKAPLTPRRIVLLPVRWGSISSLTNGPYFEFNCSLPDRSGTEYVMSWNSMFTGGHSGKYFSAFRLPPSDDDSLSSLMLGSSSWAFLSISSISLKVESIWKQLLTILHN